MGSVQKGEGVDRNRTSACACASDTSTATSAATDNDCAANTSAANAPAASDDKRMGPALKQETRSPRERRCAEKATTAKTTELERALAA